LRIQIHIENEKREMEIGMGAQPWLEEDQSEEREEHEIKASNIRSLMQRERKKKGLKKPKMKRVREEVKKQKTSSEEGNI